VVASAVVVAASRQQSFIRYLTFSPICRFTPWLIRSLDHLSPGSFTPWLIIPLHLAYLPPGSMGRG